MLKYVSSLYIPLTNLLEIVLISFAGPFQRSSQVNNFLHICEKHLTSWTIAQATHNDTSDTVDTVVEESILHSFVSPKTIISDYSSFFASQALRKFMESYGISWNSALTYARMPNGMAERMVGTIKNIIGILVLYKKEYWDWSPSSDLQGYRRRPSSSAISPF